VVIKYTKINDNQLDLERDRKFFKIIRRCRIRSTIEIILNKGE